MSNNLSKGVYNTEYKPSEGEMIIAHFFNEERIKFQQEVPIVNLRNDTKAHRRADFYLPKYKVYVEFFGRWNNTKQDRERYREKKKVFDSNKVLCVYLYPENLGVLEYCFYERLEKVMKDNRMKKELFQLEFHLFKQDYGDNMVILFFVSLAFIFILIGVEIRFVLLVTLAGIALYQIKILIEGLIFMFKKK